MSFYSIYNPQFGVGGSGGLLRQFGMPVAWDFQTIIFTFVLSRLYIPLRISYFLFLFFFSNSFLFFLSPAKCTILVDIRVVWIFTRIG